MRNGPVRGFAKIIKFGTEGRAAMLKGVDVLADAVQVRNLEFKFHYVSGNVTEQRNSSMECGTCILRDLSNAGLGPKKKKRKLGRRAIRLSHPLLVIPGNTWSQGT